MEAYLDNSATTRAYPEVGDLVYKVMCQDYGNPSSMHRKGVDAEHYVKEAKETIAKVLKVNAKDIYFTSGGTESDNLALIGCARANRRAGNHLITTSIEHPAILNTMRYLEEEEGFRVTYLPVDASGRVNLEALKEALCPETILVSVMYVNNEVGTLQPIDEAVKIVKEYNSSILFHSDAVQGFGKYHIYPKRQKIDLLSASGHKIHGPKGVGFMYIRDGIDIPSFIHGGSQERGKRAGTENVAGIVGMAKAAEIAYGNMRKRVQKEIMLRNYLIERVMHEIPDAKLNGHRSIRLPGNVNFSFKGLEGASLLILLDEDGICASGGSACNTGEERISYVIKALGVPEEYAPGTIRITLCGDTTRADVDAALVSLKRNIAILRG